MKVYFLSNCKLTKRWQERKVGRKICKYGPYYSLQRWTNGGNVTISVPTEKVEAVQALIEEGKRFDAKTELFREAAIDGALRMMRLGQHATVVKKSKRKNPVPFP